MTALVFRSVPFAESRTRPRGSNRDEKYRWRNRADGSAVRSHLSTMKWQARRRGRSRHDTPYSRHLETAFSLAQPGRESRPVAMEWRLEHPASRWQIAGKNL